MYTKVFAFKLAACGFKTYVLRFTPVYKADDELLVENRPISVLPVLSKVLEKVVYTQLCAHPDQLNYIYPHQYGFR